MRQHRRTLLAAALTALALLLAVISGPVPSAGAQDGSFVGADGQVHDSAPTVVETSAGDMFFGPDFDAACLFGERWTGPLQSVTKLARLIEKSGRRVVWTPAPSKTSVLFDEVPTAVMPHGRCDRHGLRALARALDTYQDPSYLQVRQRLADSKRQVYWRTDPHWTTVGGAVWARAIARKLDPALARHQTYTYGTETRVGLFNSLRGIDDPETLETAMPAGPVRSRTARTSVMPWGGYPEGVTDYAWTSRPARLTWPGRTLVFADSFGFYALPNLLPLFRHGRFMWIGEVDIDDVVAAIRDADTVVLEVYQTFLAIDSVLSTRHFRQKVRAALEND